MYSSMKKHVKSLGTTTIDENGQIAVPVEAFKHLDIEAGEKFVVYGDPTKSSMILVKANTINKLSNLFMDKSKKYEKMANSLHEATEPTEPTEPTEEDK